MTDDPHDDHPTPLGFPVVAVGASAGGIEALQELFAHVDADLPDMAFIVMLHLARDTPSSLDTILAERCPLPVVNVTEVTRIQPGHIYLGPPGQGLRVDNGRLRVEQEGTATMHSISALLRSLATDRREEAVAVILSGTGSDGTLGAQEVKGLGGMTVAQDPSTAAYPAMPNAAIASGTIDRILRPAAIAHALGEYARALRQGLPNTPSTAFPPAFEEILRLVQTHAGHDFQPYKRTPLRRRLQRRMWVHGLPDPDAYLRFVQDHPTEIGYLLHDMLIGVTSFFRDPEAFEALGSALADRLRNVPEGETFRVWVIGCSTGEEAYSIAMVLTEAMEATGRQPHVEIFATDANEQAVDVARAGLYPAGITVDVGPERMARYFVDESGRYRVTEALRRMVIFGVQSALSDPPFTNIDLVSCRNLLIYLEPPAQRRLLSMVHLVLKREGLLLLGSSETLGALGDYFSRVESKQQLHRRLPVPPPPEAFEHLPTGPRRPRGKAATRAQRDHAPLSEQLDAYLLQAFTPAAVVVSKQGGIVHVHGRVNRYLRMGEGAPTLNLFNMAVPGLREHLEAAMRLATTTEGPTVRSHVPLDPEGHETVHLEVSLLRDPEPLAGLFIIAFRDPPAEPPREPSADTEPEDQLTDPLARARMEHELHRTREMLQATIEEYQATNEELRLSNEELQSTNEELKASKEELQTLNEELHTVNTEAQDRLEALSRSNDDMKNLMNSIDIPTLFLDTELRIKRFTPQARAVVNLIPDDVGRPLSDLSTNLRDADLEADALHVLRTASQRRTEVRTRDGRHLLMSIHPYRMDDEVISGLVITFVDVSDLRDTQEELRGSRSAVHAVSEMVDEPLVLLSPDGDIEMANSAFCDFLGLDASEAASRSWQEVAKNTFPKNELKALLDDILSGEQDEVRRRPLQFALPGGGHRSMDARGCAFSPMGSDRRIVLVLKPTKSDA
jgi:two-component system, chemotaxis family, CheB/CheR fusion protein